jgi:hypothetical protein
MVFGRQIARNPRQRPFILFSPTFSDRINNFFDALWNSLMVEARKKWSSTGRMSYLADRECDVTPYRERRIVQQRHKRMERSCILDIAKRNCSASAFRSNRRMKKLVELSIGQRTGILKRGNLVDWLGACGISQACYKHDGDIRFAEDFHSSD